MSSPSCSSETPLSNHKSFGPIQVGRRKLRPKQIANSVCSFLQHCATFFYPKPPLLPKAQRTE
ncbi:hypothetical protein ACE6H2_010809 [Prunus campanulata]